MFVGIVSATEVNSLNSTLEIYSGILEDGFLRQALRRKRKYGLLTIKLTMTLFFSWRALIDVQLFPRLDCCITCTPPLSSRNTLRSLTLTSPGVAGKWCPRREWPSPADARAATEAARRGVLYSSVFLGSPGEYNSCKSFLHPPTRLAS